MVSSRKTHRNEKATHRRKYLGCSNNDRFLIHHKGLFFSALQNCCEIIWTFVRVCPKYNHLVAKALMLYKACEMTRVIQELITQARQPDVQMNQEMGDFFSRCNRVISWNTPFRGDGPKTPATDRAPRLSGGTTTARLRHGSRRRASSPEGYSRDSRGPDWLLLDLLNGSGVWVNLSPEEPNKIIPNAASQDLFGNTPWIALPSQSEGRGAEGDGSFRPPLSDTRPRRKRAGFDENQTALVKLHF